MLSVGQPCCSRGTFGSLVLSWSGKGVTRLTEAPDRRAAKCDLMLGSRFQPASCKRTPCSSDPETDCWPGYRSILRPCVSWEWSLSVKPCPWRPKQRTASFFLPQKLWPPPAELNRETPKGFLPAQTSFESRSWVSTESLTPWPWLM